MRKSNPRCPSSASSAPRDGTPDAVDAHALLHRLKAEALDVAPLSVALTDCDGRLIYVNAAYVKQWGLRDAGEVLGQPAIDAWQAPEEGARAIAASRAAGAWEGYMVGKRQDGTTFPARVMSSLIHDAAGAPAALLNCFVDVTQRRQNEQALRESQQMLQAVLDAIPVRVFWKDRDSRYLGCNRPFARDSGLDSPEQLIGKDDFAMGWREQAERYRADDWQVMQTGTPKLNYEEPQATPSGERSWLRTSKIPLRDTQGEIYGVLGTYEDITERKRADEALRLSEERLRTVLNVCPLPIAWADARGRIQSVNRCFTEVLGYTLQDIPTVTDWFVRAYPDPEYRRVTMANWAAEVETARNTLEPIGPIEYQATCKDGTVRQVEIVGRFLTEGLVVIFNDITDRKRAEEDRSRLREQLLQAQKMESIGRLAGGVAHDFNNLLSPILGYAELLMEDYPSSDPRHEMLEQIEHAAKRARELSRQLLAFSRKQILDLKAVDLRTMVTSFEKILRATIREDIRIDMGLPQSLGQVRADVGQIEQVLMNLAVNAQDAMPNGGVLSIGLADVTIADDAPQAPHAVPPGHYVTLTVSDTGCGMDKTTMERLFEPFFTTKEPGKGTGLGLSTAYGIVRQHGGHIQACSQPGVGTTFRICLPRVSETAIRTEPTAAPVPRARGGKGKETILVVEDNSLVREVICRMLVRQGYRAVPAETPSRAIETVEAERDRIDLLLTDIIMPEMNGRELYRQLRALHPGLRVICMSGYDSDAVAHRGMLEDGIPLLHKPFEASLLGETVRKALA